MDKPITLDDFRKQLENIRKLGLKDTIRQMPGMAETTPEGEDSDEALERVRLMIDAMTPEERTDPVIIDAARRDRIAAAAGVRPHEVKDFLKRFAAAQAVMKQMMSLSVWQRIMMVTGLRPFPRLPPPT